MNYNIENNEENTEFRRMKIKRNIFLILLCLYILASILLFCFVEGFTVLWFIFGLIFIIIPIGIFNFAMQGLQRSNVFFVYGIIINKNTWISVFYLWLYDIFYMFIFNQWKIGIWIFGLIILIIDIVCLVNTFLGKKKVIKKFIPFDLLIAIGIAVYLIYIIPDIFLREIITTISAAFFGGLLTLVGVAWTIRHNAEERELAERKRDEEMKLEEKKKYRPVFNVYHPHVSNLPEHVGVFCDEFIDMDSLIYVRAENKTNCCIIEITNFLIENTDFTAFYFRGIKINSKLYERSANLFVKKDAYLYCCFNNHKLHLKEQLQNIYIVVEDLLGNVYDVILGFNIMTENNLSVVTITGSRRIKLDKGSN